MHARALLLVVASCAMSCNAVLGLDARELADDGGTVDDVSTADVSDETSETLDVGAGDVSANDVGLEASADDGRDTLADSTMVGSDAAADSAKADTGKTDTAVADTFVAPIDTGAPDTGVTGPVDTGSPDTFVVAVDVGPCGGAAPNACGGCLPLTENPGFECNCTGTVYCTGPNAVACSTPVACTKYCCRNTEPPTCVGLFICNQAEP